MKKVLLTLLAMFLIATPSFALTTFKPYTKEIKNDKLNCTTFEKNNIKIVRNKYELKQKASDVAFGYEYIIINKNNTPITLKEMGALNVLGTMAMAKEMLKDVDAADFITGYNVVRGVKTNKENSTFTTPFPFDYKIEPNGQIRVLVLSEMGKTPIAEFQFLVNDKTSIITFDENGYSSQKIANRNEYYKSQIASYSLLYNVGSLGVCVDKGETHLVRAYIKSGINLNGKCLGVPLMAYAMRANNPEILKMLLEAGLSPDEKYMGQYPSVLAIKLNKPEILKVLLAAGANPNAEFRKTPLLIGAMFMKSYEMTKLLIDNGAEVNERAINFANKSKNEDIKKLVLSKSK